MIRDEYGNHRFYGLYRGIVIDNKDPLNQYRLKLKVPQVLHDQVTDWAWSVHEPGVARSIPTPGVGVLVMFEGGDPSFPIWLGTSVAFNTGQYPTTSLNYGSFQSTQTQPISSSIPTALTLNKTDESNNVSISNNSKIVVKTSGTYNIQFSLQLASTASSEQDVYLWGSVNGVAVSGSNGVITLAKSPGTSTRVVSSWNYVLTLNANDYFELYAEANTAAGSTISAPIYYGGALNPHTINAQTITTGSQYNATTGITQLTLASSATFTVGQTVYITGITNPSTYNGAWVTQAGTTGTSLYIKTNFNLGNIVDSGTVSEIPFTPSLIVTVTQVK
jgi:hypothetical protein